MATTPQSVNATLEQIAALTFLSVTELGGAAKPYLPKPQRGFFDLSDAVKGAFRYYSELRSKPMTVDKDELRNISGLTDQRHRQLANDGHFPAPIKGRYDLRATASGLIRYFKELHQRRDKDLGQKREQKLALEIDLLEIDKGQKQERLVSVDEIVARLTPACANMRQVILSSTLTDEERDQLIEALGSLLDNALKSPIPRNSETTPADSEQTTEADSQPVVG